MQKGASRSVAGTAFAAVIAPASAAEPQATGVIPAKGAPGRAIGAPGRATAAVGVGVTASPATTTAQAVLEIEVIGLPQNNHRTNSQLPHRRADVNTERTHGVNGPIVVSESWRTLVRCFAMPIAEWSAGWIEGRQNDSGIQK